MRRYCACGMPFKDKDSYTHDWTSLIPTLEYGYDSRLPLKYKEAGHLPHKFLSQ